MVADSRFEYRMQPGVYHRFGNEIIVNEYSMRSDPVTPKKTDSSELRVLCLGDSVLNGGALTDHGDLATTLLQEKLAADLGRPVWVGNVSEGSWGPGNLLAYVNAYGWFDADIAVIVLSGHDAGDAMTFKPTVGTNPAFPGTSPWLAAQEIVTRYLPRYLPGRKKRSSAATAAPTPAGAELQTGDPSVITSLSQFAELLSEAHLGSRPVLFLYHTERQRELDGLWLPGKPWMTALAQEHGADIRDNREEMKGSLADGLDPYRDLIHPNAEGQRVLERIIGDWVLNRLHGAR